MRNIFFHKTPLNRLLELFSPHMRWMFFPIQNNTQNCYDVFSYWRLFVQNEIEHTFDLKIAKFQTVIAKEHLNKDNLPNKI